MPGQRESRASRRGVPEASKVTFIFDKREVNEGEPRRSPAPVGNKVWGSKLTHVCRKEKESGEARWKLSLHRGRGQESRVTLRNETRRLADG